MWPVHVSTEIISLHKRLTFEITLLILGKRGLMYLQ